VKPDWAGVIKQHTRPVRDKTGAANLLTLRKGIVGVSIAAGTARRARIPFLFMARQPQARAAQAGTSSNAGQSGLTVDVSHDDFLVIRKTREQVAGDTSRRFTVKHYIPWEKIVEIVFVEAAEEIARAE